MKRSCQVLVLSCSLVLLAASVVARARSNDAARPAEWVRHNLIVKLHDLPKRYSCNDLWYRFRDILLDIGARPMCFHAGICDYGAVATEASSVRVPRNEFETRQLCSARSSSEWAFATSVPAGTVSVAVVA